MSGHLKIFVCLGYLAFIANGVLAKPFLYNAPKAIVNFVSSASASSSTPDEPYTNIADFTKQKSARLEEDEEYKNSDDEKKDRTSNEEIEIFEDSSLPPDMTNEALPSFFSKKVNKILGKLKFLADLSAPFQETQTSDGEIDELGDDSGDDSVKNTTEIATNAKELNAASIFPILRIRTESSPGFGSGFFGGYNYKKPESGEWRDTEKEPLEGQVDDPANVKNSNLKNAKVKKAALQDNDPTNGDKTRFNFNPQSIGLYFMELLATAVGLAYGAVAQFQNSGNRPS